ncbi:MAG: hypothetical protein GX974_06645 [Clostridiales bacterium]|nr:hypothetical protein [Clostridiales bacterium]
MAAESTGTALDISVLGIQIPQISTAIGAEKVIENMKYIVNETKERDIILGTFLDQRKHIDIWKAARIQYLSYSVDMGIFFEGCSRIVKYMKKR